jgi:histidine ammonia-lyase
VYGINTGFGKFATVPIGDEKLSELQRNLILSHSVGCGATLSPQKTRMMFALRINVLAKGYSGVRAETLQQMIDFFNMDCLSIVPEKGTVGASGVRICCAVTASASLTCADASCFCILLLCSCSLSCVFFR